MTQILKWPVKGHTLNLYCDTGPGQCTLPSWEGWDNQALKNTFCERVSTLKLVYLLQHNFQFWGCFLHMRGEDGQAVPEVRCEEQHRMRRMNRVRTAMCLCHSQDTPNVAHVLVRVYALHGSSHGIADKVHFTPLETLGLWDSVGNWWRVHGSCDIFFPKNKCVLKSH